jgi:hypothetical protein
VWTTGIVEGNRTTYIPYGGTTNLTSDTTYIWGARSYITTAAATTHHQDAHSHSVVGVAAAAAPTLWVNATFATALMAQSDWKNALWVSLGPETAGANQYASQMRKVFTLPTTIVGKATVFLALPG